MPKKISARFVFVSVLVTTAVVAAAAAPTSNHNNNFFVGAFVVSYPSRLARNSRRTSRASISSSAMFAGPNDRGKRKEPSTAAATGAASNHKEDLELTRNVIRRFLDGNDGDDGVTDNRTEEENEKENDAVDDAMFKTGEGINGYQKKDAADTRTEAKTKKENNEVDDAMFKTGEGINGYRKKQQKQSPTVTTTIPGCDNLARRMAEEVGTHRLSDKGDRPWWCALVGGPGTGKSVLAETLSRILAEKHEIPSVVVSMDGYRYRRSELWSMSVLDADANGAGDDFEPYNPTFLDLLRRRGCPHTIDAETLCRNLATARNMGPSGVFWFPSYDRTAPSDPKKHQIRLDASVHQAVIVVGEYLLLGKGGMVPGYVTEDEARRWKPLSHLFDTRWFVTCQKNDDGLRGHDAFVPVDFSEQRKRRIQYHLAADEDDPDMIPKLFPYLKSLEGEGAPSPFDTAETKAAHALEVATKRTDSSDVLNMHVAETSRAHASLVVRSLPLYE